MTTRTVCLAMALVALLGSVAQAQEGRQTKPVKAAPQAQRPAIQAIQVPAPEVLLIMIRAALIGLDHANRTGNYSVLREIGGPALQQHSTGQLSNAFASLRANGVDLLPTAIATPQLTRQPTVSQQGVLQLVGYFPTQPRRIDFHIVYQTAGGQWRLAGLNVGVSSAPAPQAKATPKASPVARSKSARVPTAASAKAKP